MSVTAAPVSSGSVGRERGTGRHLLRGLARRPVAVAAASWICVVVVGAAGAPLFVPAGPNNEDLAYALTGPSAAHWLGADELGRDVLARLLYGGRVTLVGVALAVAVFLIAGVGAGIWAGYVGGMADQAISRVSELTVALPAIIIALVVVSIFNDSQSAAMITIGFIGAALLSRVIRSAVLTAREQPYVAAARVSGLSTTQILRRHILPRISSVVIVQAAVYAGVALVAETGLAFLGFGPQPPNPSWGGMVADASQVISRQPWLLFPPGAVITLTVVAFGLLGNSARDVLGERWAGSTGTARQAKLARPCRTDQESLPHAAAEFVPQEAPLLSVRCLTIEIAGPQGSADVVQNVSFDVRRGDIVGVVGESGSGKTLTALGVMRMLPAAAAIRAGSSHFEGQDLQTASGRDLALVRGRKIAYISQDPLSSLDPTCTVGDLLAEALRRHHRVSRPAARRQARDLLGQVRLPEPEQAAASYPHQLSGGMAQRAAIALALAGNPALLIADEPTTALDVTVQADILDLLRELRAERDMAVLLVTHDWGVVADLCDWALVFYAGQIVESASVSELFRQPRHPYTEALLAANPYHTADAARLAAIPGAVPPPQDWPASCHFRSRCRYASDACAVAAIPMLEPDPRRLSRCLNHVAVGAVKEVAP